MEITEGTTNSTTSKVIAMANTPSLRKINLLSKRADGACASVIPAPCAVVCSGGCNESVDVIGALWTSPDEIGASPAG